KRLWPGATRQRRRWRASTIASSIVIALTEIASPFGARNDIDYCSQLKQEGVMAKRRVKFTFPPELITQPVIHNLGHKFNVITNIRRADVTDDRGWVVLELEGNDEDVATGLQWVRDLGVRVDPVEGDVLAG